MLAEFSGVESERNISKLRERKRKFLRCFHLLHKTGVKLGIVQRRLRNAQKSVMHVQSFCFANINLLLFCRSRCCRRRCCLRSMLLLSRKIATMVTWRHTPFLYAIRVDLPQIFLFYSYLFWGSERLFLWQCLNFDKSRDTVPLNNLPEDEISSQRRSVVSFIFLASQTGSILNISKYCGQRKVFRYSFSETIPIFFNRLKSDFIFVRSL